MAIREQSEKRHSRKPVLPSQTLDLLRPGQHGQGCCDLRIAYFEQSAGARRFQNQFVAAPSHIGEPRQDKRVRGGERPRFGPIIGSLRFYDDEILAAARGAEAELQETALRQSPRQQINLLVDIPSVGRERGERQTFSQFPRAIGRGRAERSETDGVAVETGRDFTIRARFERDAGVEPNGKSRQRDASRTLRLGSAQFGLDLSYAGESD